jgi:alkylation response protein AidB-like acyl-CoA dehydrogenase
VAKLMAEQGLLGITIPEEDGGQGGTLMDAVIAIETVASVCPRSADVVQAGNFGRSACSPNTAPGPEEALPEAAAARRGRDLRRHDRARGGLRGDRPQDHRHARRRRLPRERQKVFTTHASYADVILAYVRFGPGVNGIGSVLIAKGGGLPAGQALNVHERRGVGAPPISTTSTCRPRTCC